MTSLAIFGLNLSLVSSLRLMLEENMSGFWTIAYLLMGIIGTATIAIAVVLDIDDKKESQCAEPE